MLGASLVSARLIASSGFSSGLASGCAWASTGRPPWAAWRQAAPWQPGGAGCTVGGAGVAVGPAPPRAQARAGRLAGGALELVDQVLDGLGLALALHLAEHVLQGGLVLADAGALEISTPSEQREARRTWPPSQVCRTAFRPPAVAPTAAQTGAPDAHMARGRRSQGAAQAPQRFRSPGARFHVMVSLKNFVPR